jgi:uncharacterized repeat protein (TIGR04042 family)
MPEMTFAIRWPDDTTEDCYSPSLVIRDHLAVGATYTLADFLARCRTALRIASDRVQEKYGFPCTRAQAQLRRIEAQAARFAAAPDLTVHIIAFRD